MNTNISSLSKLLLFLAPIAFLVITFAKLGAMIPHA